MDRLDRFLLERVDEDLVVSADQDEGILGLSELDGFLAAIVCAPRMIMPSQWLPAVWGEFPPAWDSERQASAMFTLLVRHMNGIAGMLMVEPERFEPLFNEHRSDDGTVLIVDEWCEGFARGYALAGDDNRLLGPEVAGLVAPILAFTSVTDWAGHDRFTAVEAEQARAAITPNLRALHALSLSLRKQDPPGTVRRETPRVGRNDPCPCGSGRKYKKCCLQ